MITRIKLSTKLITVFLFAGVQPTMATGFYGYINTQRLIKGTILHEKAFLRNRRPRWSRNGRTKGGLSFQPFSQYPCFVRALKPITLRPQTGDTLFALRCMNVLPMTGELIEKNGHSSAALAKVHEATIFYTVKGENSSEEKSFYESKDFKEVFQRKISGNRFFHSLKLQEAVLVSEGPVRRQGTQGDAVGVVAFVMPTKRITKKILSRVERLRDLEDTHPVHPSGTLFTTSGRFPQREVLISLDIKPFEVLLRQGLKAGEGEFSACACYKDQQGRLLPTSFSVLRTGDELCGLIEEQMNGPIKAMEGIYGTTEQTAEKIRTLDELGFETNLLILNAPVVPVRTGETKACFPFVVSLEQRAEEAAGKTSFLIKETIKEVKDGSLVVNITCDALERMMKGTSKLAKLRGEMAATPHERAQDIQYLQGAISQMEKIPQGNAFSADQPAAAAYQHRAHAQFIRHQALLGLVEGAWNHLKHDGPLRELRWSQSLFRRKAAPAPWDRHLQMEMGLKRPNGPTLGAYIMRDEDEKGLRGIRDQGQVRKRAPGG